MLEQYIPKRFATAMLKHVIAVTLFIPYFYTKNGNAGYQDYILANLFAVLAMVFICTSWKLEFKRNGIFITGLALLLIFYNGWATYMNYTYHHYYGEQINTTISFLLFIVLLAVKDIHALIDTTTIKATIHMIVASNVCAIVFRLGTGYNRLAFLNDIVVKDQYTGEAAKQFAWLYGHKCEYGLLLVLGIAFCVCFRKFFRSIFTYLISLVILYWALIISDSYTALGASILIFIGQFLDYLINAKWWKKLIAFFVIPFPIYVIIKEFQERLNTNRDILTLGGRTHIWNYFWNYIKNHPNGTEITYGYFEYFISGWKKWTVKVNNCHNVFMNHMLRYSMPVGTIFCALCLLITLFIIKRNFSFTTIFTLIALFIPMMMDYSLSSIELTYVLLSIFIMYFSKDTFNNFL